VKRETIKPESDEHWLQLRIKNINSTEVSALFGLSPYLTEYELWHQKKDGVVIRIEENERMKWGKRLEKAIAEGIAKDERWTVEPFKEYLSISDLRLGSSFDFLANGKTILEIKNVDGMAFKDGWKVEDENIEAPVHIELQVQHQLLVSGLDEAYIGALIGGNKTVLIKRVADKKIQDDILEKCEAFWKSIDENNEPKPDFRRDASFIISMYQKTEEGKVLDKVGDAEFDELARDYKFLSGQIKELDADKAALKAQMVILAGDAEKVNGGDWTLSMKMIKDCVVPESVRNGHRDFRINWKKEPSK
jgi:putative phage-type endonuclease